MSQNSKFLIPNSLFTCQRTRGVCPRRGVSVSGEAGTYPALFSLSTTFFSSSESFFRSGPRSFSPRRRSENLSRLPFAVNNFFRLFFKKLFRPASLNPSGLARLRETFRPAAARTGYAPLGPPCQRLFRFFFAFFSFPFVLTVISVRS